MQGDFNREPQAKELAADPDAAKFVLLVDFEREAKVLKLISIIEPTTNFPPHTGFFIHLLHLHIYSWPNNLHCSWQFILAMYVLPPYLTVSFPVEAICDL